MQGKLKYSNVKAKLYHRLILLTGSLGIIFIALFGLVVVTAEDKMEVISLHHWLDAEASQFEQEYAKRGNFLHLPNRYEFETYFTEYHVPRWLSSYTQPGFYEHQLGPEDKHFVVRESPTGKGLYYVVFKDDADDYLDDYESQLHATAFTLGVMITLFLFIYGGYLVWLIAQPLNRLVSKIQLLTPDSPSFEVDSKFTELAVIEQSLLDSKQRIADFFQREQDFSRFAAHEIRTPLMILQGSAELLEQLAQEQTGITKVSQRINAACQDINLLTDTFLLLGREAIEQHHFVNVSVTQELEACLERHRQDFPRTTFSVVKNLHVECQVTAPPSFVSVLLNNLIKNAFAYAKSEISITLTEQMLEIQNDMNFVADTVPQTGRYGYGLVIVHKLCHRLQWQLYRKSDDEAGLYTVQVIFAN